MELAAFLQACSTWLAGPIAWYIIERVKWFATLQPDTKRYAAFGMSAVIAALAWLALIAIGRITPPGNWVQWVSDMWLVMTSSFGFATLINGPSLRKYRTP
jgi:drug/metabolite transporter superfamily protein YnfA